MNVHLTRRGFVATAAVGALSGCLGYQVEKTEDVENRTQRISRLEDRANQLEADIASLETDLKQSEQSVDEQRQQLADLRVEHLMTVYELADDDAAYASGAWSSAWEEFEVNNFQSAGMYFERAYGTYGAAVRGFARARELSREYDFDVTDIINDTRLYEHNMSESAFDMLNACVYYADGEQTMASSYYDRAEAHYDDAQAYGYTTPDEFEDLLMEASSSSQM